MADEADVRLARMRRVMAKLQRAGRVREFEAVAAAYAALKAEGMERVEREQRAAVRARRARERAVEARERPGVWRLPRGFASPLAAERARQGWRAREEPQHPGHGLSPWRRPSPMSERIWRPGR